jgi:hypothetical protein
LLISVRQSAELAIAVQYSQSPAVNQVVENASSETEYRRPRRATGATI